MNIYLDIDGVLLANEKFHAHYAPEFLEYVLNKFPDSTYWLTTHCQGDSDVPIQHIGHLFDNKTVELLSKIKPTSWDMTKTSGIDFSKPFLWFDDDLLSGDKQDLLDNNAIDNWIEVDLRKDPDMLLKFIQSFPIPAEYLNK